MKPFVQTNAIFRRKIRRDAGEMDPKKNKIQEKQQFGKGSEMFRILFLVSLIEV